MELNITYLVEREVELSLFSGSRAEHGEDAGQYTWNNALTEATDNPLLTTEQHDGAKDYIRGFGAWDDEEIDSWDCNELNALVLQLIAGDLREMEHYDTYEDYVAAAEQGSCSGNAYRGDDEQWYYYLGS